MGTNIRTQLSKKNAYWLPKHRQLELVHFCLQYPEWKKKIADLDDYSVRSHSIIETSKNDGLLTNPVEQIVEERLYLESLIFLIEDVAKEVAGDLCEYLLRGITEGVGYEKLFAPCCKDVYYKLYRRFFWTMDKVRR